MEKQYDLENRTEKFAISVIAMCNKLPRNTANIELISQVVRSAGSVGANYIEANEALSKKDFVNRVKICRKEAKESGYWLRILLASNTNFGVEIDPLAKESAELTNIFGAIFRKSAMAVKPE
jgi:four helix bundle protein